jgi:hypothetical protein
VPVDSILPPREAEQSQERFNLSFVLPFPLRIRFDTFVQFFLMSPNIHRLRRRAGPILLIVVGKPASDRSRKRLTAADAKRRRAGSARCAFLIQGAVRPCNAQFERRISMSPCVRTSASSDSRWDKSASSWDTCASTSISRSSASTWETRASASASFRCPVGSILGDATGQSRCNLAGSTSRSVYAMVISLLQPAHRC